MELKVYGNPKKMDPQYEHRGITITIYQLDRGAIHCKKQHDYRSKKCAICKADIEASKVFLAFAGGKQASQHCESLSEALKDAKLLIDYQTGDGIDEAKDPKNKSGSSSSGGSSRSAGIRDAIEHLGWGKHALAILKEDEASVDSRPRLPK